MYRLSDLYDADKASTDPAVARLRSIVAVPHPLHKVRYADGVLHDSDIPNSVVRAWGAIPTWRRDHGPRSVPMPMCSVRGCETISSDWHHFAPRNTFGEAADLWPVMPLCKTHHVEWHRSMNGYRWNRKAAE